MNSMIAVFIGGGLGSVLRFLITKLSLKYIESGFPWATFISNILACLLLGILIIFFKEKFQEEVLWKFFLITGFCGGFSTFSTFSFENYVLFRNDQMMLALLNVVISVGFGFAIMYVLLKDFRFES